MATTYKTKQKEIILEFLKNQDSDYVTVNDIKNYLENNGQQVGLTTIYRRVDGMEKEGIVSKLSVEGSNSKVYKYLGDDDESGFFIKCESCGDMIHMSCHHLEELYEHIMKDHGFFVNTKKTVFYGKCMKCQKKNA